MLGIASVLLGALYLFNRWHDRRTYVPPLPHGLETYWSNQEWYEATKEERENALRNWEKACGKDNSLW